MVKTLRITSFALAAVSVLTVIALIALSFVGAGAYRSVLDQPGVVEQMKGTLRQTKPTEQTSPLVNQAKALALRLDPPPPPPPPVRQEPTEQPRPQEPIRPAPVVSTARFELLATAHNPDFPDRSLALIQPTNSPLKWVRQGDKIGHLEIGAIEDGKITLLKDGQFHSEMKTPAPTRPFRPLLKSDALAQGLPTQTVNRPFMSLSDAAAQSAQTSAAGAGAGAGPMPDTFEPAPEGMPAGVSRSVRLRQAAQRPIGNAATKAVSAPEPVATEPAAPPPREPTIAEQKASVEESIQSIRQIMSQQRADATPEEQQQEMQAWQSLLEVLESEKKKLEQQASGASD